MAQYFVVRRMNDAAVTLSNRLKRKTTEKGACHIIHLPDDTYTVTVSKESYEEAIGR